MRSAHKRWLVVALVGAMALAGCAGGGDEAGSAGVASAGNAGSNADENTAADPDAEGAEADDASGDSSAGDGSEQDDGSEEDDGAVESESPGEAGNGATAPPSDSRVATVAIATSITPGFQEMSTHLDRPEDSIGLIRVNGAHTSSSYTTLVEQNTIEPAAGNVIVAVDIEVFFDSNLFENAFRMFVDDEVYQSIANINEVGNFGSPLNWQVLFEVPASATEMRFEAGVPEGIVNGVRASYDLSFEPAAGEVPYGYRRGSVSGEITADEIVGGPQDTAMMVRPGFKLATMTPTAAWATARNGDVFAHDGTKLIVVEAELLAKSSGNLFDEAFRLRADDEWYASRYTLNELPDTGETVKVTLAFEVPLEAETFLLEAGGMATLASDSWPSGYSGQLDISSATWELVFSG